MFSRFLARLLDNVLFHLQSWKNDEQLVSGLNLIIFDTFYCCCKVYYTVQRGRNHEKDGTLLCSMSLSRSATPHRAHRQDIKLYPKAPEKFDITFFKTFGKTSQKYFAMLMRLVFYINKKRKKNKKIKWMLIHPLYKLIYKNKLGNSYMLHFFAFRVKKLNRSI